MRKDTIYSTLVENIDCQHLEVIDESHRHHVPKGSETHYKVVIVSEAFTNMLLIKRHRLINHLLNGEFKKGLHALSIHACSPAEWLKKEETASQSPDCRDGFKHNQSHE